MRKCSGECTTRPSTKVFLSSYGASSFLARTFASRGDQGHRASVAVFRDQIQKKGRVAPSCTYHIALHLDPKRWEYG
jgi:hypothetical protein